MSDSIHCPESQDCHLIPLYDLLSCSSVNSHCSFRLFFFFPIDWTILLTFSQNTLQYFSLSNRHFGMTLDLQRDESWSLVCAACCHNYITDVCHHAFIYLITVSVHSFFFFFFIKIFNLITINQTKVDDMSIFQVCFLE